MLLQLALVLTLLCLALSANVSAAATRIINAPLGSNVTLLLSSYNLTNSTKVEWRQGRLDVDQLTIYDIQFHEAGEYSAMVVDKVTRNDRDVEPVEIVILRVVEAPRCALLLSTSDAKMSQLTCAVQFSATDKDAAPDIKWLDVNGDCSWTNSSTDNTRSVNGHVTRTVTSVCRLPSSVLARGRLPVCRVTFGDDLTYNCSVESCPGGSPVASTTAAVPTSSTNTKHTADSSTSNSTRISTQTVTVQSVDATYDTITSSTSLSSSITVQSAASPEKVAEHDAGQQHTGSDKVVSEQTLQNFLHFSTISHCVIIGLLVLLVVIAVTQQLCRHARRPTHQHVSASESRNHESDCLATSHV